MNPKRAVFLTLALGLLCAPGAQATDAPAPPGSPDGRAYEVVSPGAAKGGGGIGGALGGPWYAMVSPDGERVLYLAYSPFGDATHGMGVAGGGLAYVASRGSDGWSSRFVGGVPQPVTAVQSTSFTLFMRGASRDLSTIAWAVDYRMETGFASGVWLYRNSTGNAEPVLSVPSGASVGGSLPQAVDVSHDGTRVVARSPVPLGPVPGDPVMIGDLLYVNGDEGPELVNVASDGQVINEGGASYPTHGGGPRNAISEDGSRVFFSSQRRGETPDPFTGAKQLYVKIMGQTGAIEISASRHSEPQPPLQDVQFAGASADGTRAFFVTSGELTDDAPAGVASLYRFDLPGGASSGQLSMISGGRSVGSSASGAGVNALVSDDGSTVYYATPDDGGSIYRYDARSGATTLVAAQTGQVELTTRASASGAQSAAETTPSGSHLAFVARGALVPGVANTGMKVYRYDREAERIDLVSTSASEPSTPFDAELLSIRGPEPMSHMDLPFDANVVSDDGRYVFFGTSAALVPGDTNGVGDVYRWRDGNVALVSDGSSVKPASLIGAGADGSSVFFMTQSALVPQDGDGEYDIYAARIGGGFAIDDSPECAGEACQRDHSRGPNTSNPGSSTLRGRGDVARSRERPRATLTPLSATARAKLARRGKVRIVVRVNRAGTVTIRARARAHGRRFAAGGVTKRVFRPGRTRMVLRLSRPARRALANGERLRVTLAVRFGGKQQRRMALRLSSSERKAR